LNNFNLKPSGEIDLHYEIMKSFDTDFFVVHLHPTYIISAIYYGLNLPDLVKEFPELRRYIRVADNTDSVLLLIKDLAKQCKNNLLFNDNSQSFDFDIVCIPNHGIVSVGKSIFEAYEHIERLVHISRIVLSSYKK
jgi:ribulose-5-phosphate 4-epimerase/fuculose-1-phosphate aldolase